MKFYCFLLVFFVIFSTFSFGYDWSNNPGDGSVENPFQISEPEHLMSIGSDVNLLDKNFILTSDIVFDPNNNPAHVFTDSLIAADPDNDGIPVFSGHLDGDGYKIVNLKIISTDRNTGLFGRIDCSSASQVAVQNLTFVNPILSGLQRVGPLVGLAEECTIQNCHTVGGTVGQANSYVAGGLIGGGFYTNLKDCFASADVFGNLWVGGLSGSNNSSTFIDCSASGDVVGSQFVGGLVGDFKQWFAPELNEREEVINCHASGNVHCSTDSGGGLIGLVNVGLIQDCSATGKVTGGSKLGGLIGEIDPEKFNQTPPMSGPTKIKRCYSSGDVQGSSNYIGGLIGSSYAVLVRDCYASGDVSSTAGKYVGGLTGYNRGYITNSSASGVTAGNNYVGGLIGQSNSDVSRCFAKCMVTGVDFAGGLIGHVAYQANVYNSYAQSDVTGTGKYVGGFCGAANGANTISNCYSAGFVSGTNHYIGAFMGWHYFGATAPDYQACFWSIEDSPNLLGVGAPYDQSRDEPNIVGLSIAQMQIEQTFTGWDFVGESDNGDNEIWRMCVDGVDYPRLSWEFAKDGDFACGDGVDVLDLQVLAENWLTSTTGEPDEFNYSCDGNGDEKINMKDFEILSSN